MEWKIGCSGYHYPDWKGIFYPEGIPQRKWFEFYCEHFNTLELNVTYYRFPRVDTLKKWYNRSPKDFSFSVKAPRHITHFRKFRDAQRMLHDFNQTAKDGLREKLGCVLFQFPANYRYEAERLDRIIEILDGSVRNVLEFRHESWWDPVVYETLEKNHICFCGMSHPSLPQNAIGTTDTLYYRFHGVPHLYNSKYEVQKLEQIAQDLLSNPQARQAYVYFNNTADGHAITNAKQLQDICELVH
jgi:uncharacterized protein YecE (DUF72 family)